MGSLTEETTDNFSEDNQDLFEKPWLNVPTLLYNTCYFKNVECLVPQVR